MGKDKNAQEQRNREIEKELGVSRNVDVGRPEGNLLGVLKDYNRQLEGELNDQRSRRKDDFPIPSSARQSAPPQAAPPAGRPSSSLEPGQRGSSGVPAGSRTADASPSTGAAKASTVQQMSYRDAEGSRYNPYYDPFDDGSFPHDPDPGFAQPGYTEDWINPGPGFSRPSGSSHAMPMPDIDRLPYSPDRNSTPLPAPAPMPFRYGIDDPGHMENLKATGFGSEPDRERMNYLAPDRTAPADAGRETYTVDDALDFLGRLCNEAKPVSERTGLSLPFILGHIVGHYGTWPPEET